MDRINNRILEIYQEVKQNPWVILIKPYMLLLTPFYFIKKRWNSKPELIFLIETFISGHNLLKKEIRPSYRMQKIISYELAKGILEQRVKEDGRTSKNLEQTKERFVRGDYMMVLIVDDTPTSYVFISEKVANFEQFHLKEKMDSNCFAIYDVYTFKRFRGMGFYEDLISLILKKRIDYKKFWLWVMKHNQASLKVHDRLQVNSVIRIYEESFRFGFRSLKITNTNFPLSDLIYK
jgi:hypothetical protein